MRAALSRRAWSAWRRPSVRRSASKPTLTVRSTACKAKCCVSLFAVSGARPADCAQLSCATVSSLLVAQQELPCQLLRQLLHQHGFSSCAGCG